MDMRTTVWAFRSALVSISAVLASFGLMYTLCATLGVGASPAILAAALSVGLMRRPGRLEPRALLIRFLLLPFIALAAGLVGLALLRLPALGAVFFTSGIALSILLRRYGERARAIGDVIALPLMSILVVPVHIDVGGDRWLSLLLLVLAGAVSLASAALVSGSAGRLGLSAPSEPPHIVREHPTQPGRMHVATRMALQMYVALGLAFAIGLSAYPEHWAWIVLTAFIVCSGALGRGDAIYKGLLRLGGAVGGALLAALVARVSFPDPAVYAAAVFFVLFLGIWLRQVNYAWWAACTTLIFALLQGPHDGGIAPLLAMRVLCIVIGALCGVGATWFVYPIRTDQVVRKRVAEALAALRELLAHHPGSPGHRAGLASLDHHAAELERVAPPMRLHRKLFSTPRPDEHPATWLDLMNTLLAEARSGEPDRAHMGAEMRRLGAMLKSSSAVSAGKSGSSGPSSGASGHSS